MVTYGQLYQHLFEKEPEGLLVVSIDEDEPQEFICVRAYTPVTVNPEMVWFLEGTEKLPSGDYELSWVRWVFPDDSIMTIVTIQPPL